MESHNDITERELESLRGDLSHEVFPCTIPSLKFGTCVMEFIFEWGRALKAENRTNFQKEVDVVVVGAGIAGISAAHALQKSGLSILLLEAETRVGGRAHTQQTEGETPCDLGCRWLHNATVNPLCSLMEEQGFTIERSLGNLYYASGKQWLSQEESRKLISEQTRLWHHVEAAGRRRRDVRVSQVLRQQGRWKGLFRYSCAVHTGCDVEQASVQDISRYEDLDVNWLVLDGFGAFVETWSEGLPIILNQPVHRIVWDSDGVSVESRDGVVKARAALLTVSIGVLQSDAIAFEPALPSRKQDAINGLTMGHLEIFVAEFTENFFDIEENSQLYIQSADGSTIGYLVRPGGQNAVAACLGGQVGQDLLREGKTAIERFCLDPLSKVYGTNVHDYVKRTLWSEWGLNPWIRGGMSASAVGNAEQREELARSIKDRLFFAGEATSAHAHGSAHGAYQSGVESARHLKALLS